MADNRKESISEWIMILVSILVGSLSTFLIIVSGIIYTDWINKDGFFKEDKKQESTSVVSSMNNTTISKQSPFNDNDSKTSTTDCVIISSKEEYDAFINNSNNIGKIIQIPIYVFSTNSEIINDQEITFMSMFTGAPFFIDATYLPEMKNLDMNDEVTFVGEYTGRVSSYGNPLFDSISVSFEGSHPIVGQDEKNGDYENVAIKDNAEYSEIENNPDMDGVGFIMKAQFVSYAPNTETWVFYLDGREMGVVGRGSANQEIVNDLKLYDWVYVWCEYSRNLPPYYVGESGVIVEEVVKID